MKIYAFYRKMADVANKILIIKVSEKGILIV